MQTETVKPNSQERSTVLIMPATNYRAMDIPGLKAESGSCYVKVTDIPALLERFMDVNPRVPSRNKRGSLSGPVIKGILETLKFTPEEMSIKNQGIYILVRDMSFHGGKLKLLLSDSTKHGIVNGGHTYAAIREAVENADEKQLKKLEKAYVQLHILKGIDRQMVPDIAEGLNRSKQVDDLSLMNLQGAFEQISNVLQGIPGADKVSFHQGAPGLVNLSDLVVMLEMFNYKRFPGDKGPANLYSKKSLALKYFKQDMETDPEMLSELIKKLPDILKLSDRIRQYIPFAAKKNKFKFGLAKIGESRAGSSANRGIELPFIGEKVNYRVPNGWVYPILSAFRANLRWGSKGLEWMLPIEELLVGTIDQLVGVCVAEHRRNIMRPDLLGKSENAYSQCYSKVELYLVRKNVL